MILFEKTVFPILNLDSDHDWEELLPLCRGLFDIEYLDKNGLLRLLNVLKPHCQCIMVEREYIDKDYRNTFANFHAKRFSTPPSRCIRLHFFTNHIEEPIINENKSLRENNNTYLGYSVIRATRPNSIGRTFLSSKIRLDPESYICTCDEDVHIMGEKLHIKGFPFISQDSDATVCAESSLWMILRYFSNRYPNYAETLPFQITELASNHAMGGRIYPSGGLTSWQLAEALRLNNFAPIIYSKPPLPDNADQAELDDYECKRESFEHLLYTYIESGFPILTTITGHVFPAFGHSSDFSHPPDQSDGKPVYSSFFNQSITIADDNCFPYQVLHKRNPTKSANASHHTFDDIQQFIVPLPEKVFLTAENAQAVISEVLAHKSTGIAQNSPSLKGKDLTFRLFLTSSRSFKAKINERGMGHPLVAKFYKQLPLPHFIWICEISLTADYLSDNQIVGEVIWDATRNAYEPDGWIAVHYPELLSIDIGSPFNQPQKIRKIPLDKSPQNKSNPYPLFKSNLNTLSV